MSLPKIVISDASCLINLEKIGELNLLEEVFGKIIVTKEIATEFGNQLPDFIEVWEAPTDSVPDSRTPSSCFPSNWSKPSTA